MKNHVVSILLCSLLISFLSMFCFGCEDEYGEDPELDLDELVDQGKTYIELGRGKDAHDTFLLAQTVDAQDHDVAFGLVLSNALLTVNLVDGLVDFIADSFGESDEMETAANDEEEPTPWIGDTIQTYLESIFGPVIGEMSDQFTVLDGLADFRFDINKMPVIILDNEIYSFNGDWDSQDLIWINGGLKGLNAIFYMIYSTNLNFEPRHLTTMDIDLEEDSISDVLMTIGETLYYILNDPYFPDFFTNTDRAQELMPQTGIDLGFFLQSLVEAQNAVMADGENPYIGMLGFRDINSNGKKDEGEPFTFNNEPFPQWLENLLPATNTIIMNMSYSLFDGTSYDVNPDAPNYWSTADLNLAINEIIGHEWSLIPDYQIDLGGYFQDPHPEEIKAFMSDMLECAISDQGLINTLLCIRDTFENYLE